MSEHLNSEEEDLLQSALSTAFSPAPLPRQSVGPDPAPETVSQPANISAPAVQAQADITVEPESADDVWKDEYEAHVAEWRRRSAEQRQKAEQTRAEWEAIREKERKEGRLRQSDLSLSTHSTSGWEKLTAGSATASVAGRSDSPSPADVRDLVSGEGQGRHSKEYIESALPGEAGTSTSTPPEHQHEHDRSASHPVSETESKQDKWDSMTSSINSSFPSMSFPSDPHSPISSIPRNLPPANALGHHHASAHAHAHEHGHGHHHPHHHEETRTATLSVFDSSLSPKTRALALLSSVAINVLLPFVNGVMLGFGELFAKNVVIQWLGWRVPGTASAASSRGSGRVALGRR
ncbi:hypothetical protein DICSQDRAFT_178259 [Dichomitus squalens LYAD-421 SS1]|uniref:uncharacterized protein n=1 Tax=Dichomitus squalens (strain LYAD-421) TaxID=732165 RepID=UPI0004413065|nr:uncharacterized protein DICSQDRAFT_178259 [Dichomitus squalens LYAD-421 SS1]EJF64625.1 hypothetical protein DICSQDRAFT_178259 [Dichomitus squalens LYAD-421 SS1]